MPPKTLRKKRTEVTKRQPVVQEKKQMTKKTMPREVPKMKKRNEIILI